MGHPAAIGKVASIKLVSESDVNICYWNSNKAFQSVYSAHCRHWCLFLRLPFICRHTFLCPGGRDLRVVDQHLG